MSGVYGTSVRFSTNSVGFCDIIIESSPSEPCFELAYEVISSLIKTNKDNFTLVGAWRFGIVQDLYRHFAPADVEKIWNNISNRLSKNEIDITNAISNGKGPLFIWGISLSSLEIDKFITFVQKEMQKEFGKNGKFLSFRKVNI